MPSRTRWSTRSRAPMTFGGIFDYNVKSGRLVEADKELENPEVWNDPKRVQELGRERKSLETVMLALTKPDEDLTGAAELFEFAHEEGDDETIEAIEADTVGMRAIVEDMEFCRMFSGPMDAVNCFIGIQAGAGDTETCDWASVLLRQYLGYCERKGFKTEVLEESEGDVAGIKSASIKVEGEYAFGFLCTETGVHRLVRKSPFDSAGGRHTSFLSIFVYPGADDPIEIEVNPVDLRVDTYRTSGAGGQHISRTDSAVRTTYISTGIVVQRQNDRSQYRNRAETMTMLKLRLYEHELRKRQAAIDAQEAAKTDVGWGHQICSYVLDQSRIKNLRTNVGVSNTQKVLDGDLDPFIQTSLRQGV